MNSSILSSWNSTKCIPWLVIIIMLYMSPFVFDLSPDKDTYIMGVPFLGLYGTIILTLLSIGFSIIYSMNCVQKSLVMRCGVFGCGEDELMFPPDFPEHEKIRYKATLKDTPRGFSTLHPWSEFNKKLQKLNSSLHDTNFTAPRLPQEYYTKLQETEDIKQQRYDDYVKGIYKTGID